MTGLALAALALLALWQARQVAALRRRVAALELQVFAGRFRPGRGASNGQP
jgi:hypothetical protein